MRRKVFYLVLAALTLALGIASTKMVFLPFVSIISLLFLLGVPLVIVITVIRHGVVLKSEWRPFIGKGFYAIFLWLLPSLVVALVNFIYWSDRTGSEVFYRPEPTISEQVAGNLIVFVLTTVYCATGAGLCLWVKRHKINDHWLLRNK
ncbi:MAG TPA: hypothetical protein VF599_23075 [Pyrinomonadaceae bacterium]